MVTIGFNTVGYSVLEDDGSVNVTVSILNETLARNVLVTLSTESGSTSRGKLNEHSFCSMMKTWSLSTIPAGTDYTDTTVTLTFDAIISTQMVTVSIIDDNVVEDTEFINLALTSVDNAVMLNPATNRIYIEDVDSELTNWKLHVILFFYCIYFHALKSAGMIYIENM